VVTVLLLDVDRRDSSSQASASSLTVTVGVSQWQARFAVLSTTRAREGAVRVGAVPAPHGARREDRFVPLAAVVPTAHASHWPSRTRPRRTSRASTSGAAL